jgi:hypothetical protein
MAAPQRAGASGGDEVDGPGARMRALDTSMLESKNARFVNYPKRFCVLWHGRGRVFDIRRRVSGFRTVASRPVAGYPAVDGL